jgi:hypothetical protein
MPEIFVMVPEIFGMMPEIFVMMPKLFFIPSVLIFLVILSRTFFFWSRNDMTDGDDDDSTPEEQEKEHDEYDDLPPFEAVDNESDDSSTNHEEKLPVSRRSNVPSCDFNDCDYALTCAFPHIFPLGRAYYRSTGSLNREQLNHLFTQFHQAPARDRKLLAYVFDNQRRSQTMNGVKVLSRGNSKAYADMDALVNTPGFQDKLEAAISNPDSKEARQLLKTLHNCLTIAGKKQSYGSHELRNVVPTVKEISKSLGPPSCFVTCSLDSKGNPRAFRLSKAVVTNRDMPAHLPDENVDEFIAKMVADGNATQEHDYFPFPMDESARAKESIDNPIAYVQEFMAVVHTLLSVVIGITPENFFSQTSGSSTRKSVYLGHTKGALGYILSYYGVIEANNRGELHFHLICFGSLPPHLLTNFATCPEIRKKIAEVFASYYTTELDREFIVYKALQNVLSLRKRRRLPVFTLDKQNTANLLKTERTKPLAGLTDDNCQDKIRERTKLQDCQQQIHSHIPFTCCRGIMGKTGCRYSRPYPCNEEINVVCLSARQKIPGTNQYDPEDGGNADEPWIATEVEDSSVWQSKSPIDALDRTVFYWDLARRRTEPMEEPFPNSADYVNGTVIFSDEEKLEKAKMVATQLCESGPAFLRSNFDDMVRLSLDDLLDIFSAVNHEMLEMNGKLVEHSSLISDVTGSHNNVAVLGSSEQGKSAAFYLGPYFAKEKFGFEESLMIMALANKHIHTYESTAEDTGTKTRYTKYFIQRCLNQHCLKMEISDYQMAAAVLSMPVILRSNKFAFIDPYSSMAYIKDKMRPIDDASEDLYPRHEDTIMSYLPDHSTENLYLSEVDIVMSEPAPVLAALPERMSVDTSEQLESEKKRTRIRVTLPAAKQPTTPLPPRPQPQSSLHEQQLENIRRLRTVVDDERESVRAFVCQSGNGNDVIEDYRGVTLRRSSAHRLQPGHWLNDELVQYFAKIVTTKDVLCSSFDLSRKRSNIFSSLFYTRMMGVGSNTQGYNYEGVRRWTSRTTDDIFNLDKILIPINVDYVHWIAVMVSIQDKTIQVYDPIGRNASDANFIYDMILRFLFDEHFAKKRRFLSETLWHHVQQDAQLPLQPNGYDCGVYVLAFICFSIFGQSQRFRRDPAVTSDMYAADLRFQLTKSIMSKVIHF